MEAKQQTHTSIDGRSQLLILPCRETSKIGKNATNPIERHLTAIESQLDEIHDLKLRMQKLKIENGVKVEQVAKWTPR